MKAFYVSVPICGYAMVVVEAENEEDAIKKAMESEISINDIESWEALEEIVSGNCFNGQMNRAEAEEQ